MGITKQRACTNGSTPRTRARALYASRRGTRREVEQGRGGARGKGRECPEGPGLCARLGALGLSPGHSMQGFFVSPNALAGQTKNNTTSFISSAPVPRHWCTRLLFIVHFHPCLYSSINSPPRRRRQHSLQHPSLERATPFARWRGYESGGAVCFRQSGPKRKVDKSRFWLEVWRARGNNVDNTLMEDVVSARRKVKAIRSGKVAREGVRTLAKGFMSR